MLNRKNIIDLLPFFTKFKILVLFFLIDQVRARSQLASVILWQRNEEDEVYMNINEIKIN